MPANSSICTLNISPEAKEILCFEPEIAASVVKARSLPSYKAGYRPTVVELLLDDLPYVRTVCGEPVYIRPCRPNYDPPFWEIKFDGQMALFVVKGGEVIVNRIAEVADWLVGLGLLGSAFGTGEESK